MGAREEREAGAEIEKAVVCCLLPLKIQSKPAPNRVFLFLFNLHRGSKKILYARKRKFVLSIDTDEIGYLSKSVTLEVMNDMT